MTCLGSSTESSRAVNFPPFNPVDAPYGSFDLENMDSHGGWVFGSGTIQNAWYDSGINSWNLQQINQGAETPGAAAAGDPFVSVFGQQQHFAYRDAAGASLDAWYDSVTKNWSLQQINMSGVTSGAAAVGDPFVTVFGDQQHFVYRDSTGTLQDVWYDSGGNTWSLQQINLGGVTKGPAAGGDPCVSVFGQQHFVYRDLFGGIWDAWYDAGANQWKLQQINLGGRTNAPIAAADPQVLVAGDQHFSYRDGFGIVWDAWYDAKSGAWQSQQLNGAGGLTNAPAASDGPVAWVDGSKQHFTCVDANGTIWDSWSDGGTDGWRYQQINQQGVSLANALNSAMWTALNGLPSLP